MLCVLKVGSKSRVVKELDLFESNHGCGLNALSQEKIRNERTKTLHGPELVRNVFPGPFGAGRAIAHGFSMFEYFDLTGLELICCERFRRHRGFGWMRVYLASGCRNHKGTAFQREMVDANAISKESRSSEQPFEHRRCMLL